MDEEKSEPSDPVELKRMTFSTPGTSMNKHTHYPRTLSMVLIGRIVKQVLFSLTDDFLVSHDLCV